MLVLALESTHEIRTAGSSLRRSLILEDAVYSKELVRCSAHYEHVNWEPEELIIPSDPGGNLRVIPAVAAAVTT